MQCWRDAITLLLELNREVWRGFAFFLGANGFIVALVLLFGGQSNSAWFVISFLLFGLGRTLVGRYVLRRNRVYYLQMLLKKSLLEKELGFYEVRFSGTETDLAFPWRVTPEVVAQMKEAPEAWIAEQVRGPGTIARWLFIIDEVILGVYVLVLALALRAIL